MVFVVLTRAGYDAIKSRVIVSVDAVWINPGILSEEEAAQLRGSGWNLTSWTNPIDPKDVDSEFATVQLHHPDQVIWFEVTAG